MQIARTANKFSASQVCIIFFSGNTNTSAWLGIFCGTVAFPVITTGNIMTVKFRTDSTKVGKGFLADYFIGEFNGMVKLNVDEIV